MTNLSILGTGNMGQAIAAVAAKGGHSVQLLGQADDREAALQHFARSVSPAEAEALRRALDAAPADPAPGGTASREQARPEES